MLDNIANVIKKYMAKTSRMSALKADVYLLIHISLN